jgi:hypothetical protein
MQDSAKYYQVVVVTLLQGLERLLDRFYRILD